MNFPSSIGDETTIRRGRMHEMRYIVNDESDTYDVRPRASTPAPALVPSSRIIVQALHGTSSALCRGVVRSAGAFFVLAPLRTRSPRGVENMFMLG